MPEAQELTSLPQELLTLHHELLTLADLPVPRAAKERGWANVRRELEKRALREPLVGRARAGAARTAEVRSLGRMQATGAGRGSVLAWGGRRWALGLAAAAFLVLAVVLGVCGAGVWRQSEFVQEPGSVTSVAGSSVSDVGMGPVMSGPNPSANGSTSSSLATATTGTSSATSATVTSAGGSPVSTQSGQNASSGPSGASSTSSTSASGVHPTTSEPPATTEKPQTTTTAEQLSAAAQRETSARAAVFHLGNLVMGDDTSGARSLVAPEAYGSLDQMMLLLNEPSAFTITGAHVLGDGTVRVTVEFVDSERAPEGGLVERVKSFVIKVRVSGDEAVITGISWGS